MPMYPGAHVKLLKHNYTATKTAKNAVILHSTASDAESQYNWFNNPSSYSSSHFHIAKNGVVEQMIDTNFVSWANAAANDRSVTIETAGVQGGDEKWTDEQVLAIIKLVTWITKTHKISPRQMESSAASEKGIGWHRLGIDGNFPRTGILRGRNQRGGGEYWSKSLGKVCPGNLRIQQMPAIIAAVKKNRSVVSQIKDVLTPNKSWPKADLPAKSSLSTVKSAWGKLLKNSRPDKAMQSWLKAKRFYPGKIDGAFGAMSVKALQSFLQSKGVYSGKIDGLRGPLTIQSEVKYLNTQRKFL